MISQGHFAILRKLILLVSVWLPVVAAYSQTNRDSELVSVQVSIVGRGTPTWNCWGDSIVYCFTNIRIANTQDTTIRFFIMSTSWPSDNLVISDRNIAHILYCGSDSNFPETITLKPKQVLEFHTAFTPKRGVNDCRFKVGFIYYTELRDIDNWDPKRKVEEKIIWSKEVVLPEYLFFDYKVLDN